MTYVMKPWRDNDYIAVQRNELERLQEVERRFLMCCKKDGKKCKSCKCGRHKP